MKSVALIVLNNFKNDARVLKEAITLQKNGYSVKVIALHEQNLKKEDVVSDIKVERISLITKKLPKLFLVQLIKYVELCIKTIYKHKDFDIIHCNDLAPLPIAVIIKIFINRRVKIVYDAHEYQTERNGLKGIKKTLSTLIEKVLIKKVDHVLTVSDGIAEEYKKKYKIDKPTIVYNCPFFFQQKKTDIFREKFEIADNQTIYLYQGGLYKGRGLEISLEAFKQLDNENSKEVLVIIGFGELEELVKSYAEKYSNIFYHDAVSPTDLLKYTSSADVGLCLIENTSLSYYFSMPNKFFEYSMVGLPVISNNVFELNKLVNKYNNGWILDKFSSVSLVKVIKRVGSVNNDKEFYEKKSNTQKIARIYNWETQEKVLLEAYSTLYN
ncbi:glycosyltransferase [Oceanobacillus profundus]|uniref:glycosyltransferase n=1 Tax=Oceanobacillus profundus TaxID=372463 RepID=UPI00363A9935